MTTEFSGDFPSPKDEKSLQSETFWDKKNHLLASKNFGHAATSIVIVTGFPEGPNQLAQSEGTKLDTFFAQASPERAIAQVYLGSNLRDIQRLSLYLDQVLARAGNSAVKLMVFSAGAQSLVNLPKENYPKIASLTIFSPLIGGESLGPKIPRIFRLAAAFLLRIPKTSEYLETIASLIKALDHKPVEVVLGESDQFINSRWVKEAFGQRFPQIPITLLSRGHPPTPEELLTFGAETH